MTSPLAPLPYSVTYYPSTAIYMYVDTNLRGSWPNAYYQHRFTQGSYLLQVKYFSTGRPLRLDLGTQRLATLSGTGWLTTTVQFSVRRSAEVFLVLSSATPFTQADSDAGVTAAITVFPTPLFTEA